MNQHQNPYPTIAAASVQLSHKQRTRAVELCAKRPEVVPGTRAIINPVAAKEWFDQVYIAMEQEGVKEHAHIQAFCDLAGVPD